MTEIERLRAETDSEIEDAFHVEPDMSIIAGALLEEREECSRREDKLRKALTVALEAMQANIAYAMRKDEHALARGIKAARAALEEA